MDSSGRLPSTKTKDVKSSKKRAADISSDHSVPITVHSELPPKKKRRHIPKESNEDRKTALEPRVQQREGSEPPSESNTKNRKLATIEPASREPDAQGLSYRKRKVSVEEIEVDITAPEPPSKKGLRRLKKGKPLPPSKSGAESTPEPDPKKEKKTEVEKRSEHGVWIGNLPWTVSKTDLRKFFVEYSDITDDLITRVHMPGPDDKKSANKAEEKKVGKQQHNKGFAYVDFSTADAVEKAIELSEQLLSGRRVLIKNSKSFEGRPEKTKGETRNDGKPPSKRVFLGNLSFDTSEDSLREHFEKCGAIESVKVAQFEDSGKCKGYAWIVFEQLEAAQSAVRGFVHFEDEASDASESDVESEAGDIGELKPKKTKMKKRWVNKIKGRPLRMEFAEDAQVRYKKRYGKEGTKRTAPQDMGAKDTPSGDLGSTEKVAAKVKYMLPYAARLTGGIVESTGKKTMF